MRALIESAPVSTFVYWISSSVTLPDGSSLLTFVHPSGNVTATVGTQASRDGQRLTDPGRLVRVTGPAIVDETGIHLTALDLRGGALPAPDLFQTRRASRKPGPVSQLMSTADQAARRKSIGPDRKAKLKRAVAARDGAQCAYCQSPFTSLDEATVDHLIPYVLVRTWAKWDLVLACPDCNNDKGEYIPAPLVPIICALIAAQLRRNQASVERSLVIRKGGESR